MKNLLISIFFFCSFSIFAQLSPRSPSNIQNNTTVFGVPVSQGNLVFDVSAGKYFYCITNTASTYTLATAPANFVQIPSTVTQWITNGSDIYYSTGKVGVGTSAPAATTPPMSLSTSRRNRRRP